MRVMLNGATAGTNFGDYLFAQMFQEFVADKVGIENVYWYRSRYAMSDFFSKHLNNRNRADIKNMHALVYISGGYFCGQDRNIRDRILRFLRYFYVGLRSICCKVPYAIIGLDVAVPTSKWLKHIEKKILKNAELIVVRNKESYDCVKAYGIDRVIESVDSAFAIEPSLFADRNIPDEIAHCDKKILLFHISAGMSGNSGLKEKVVPIVNAFLKNHPEYAVLVTADQFSAAIEETLEDICGRLECTQILRYVYDDPIALCKVIDCADTIVTHKLHVGIVGARLGKAVISFSGHTEKIQRLYHQLGEDDRSVPLAALDFAQGCAKLEAYYNRPICVSEEVIAQARNNFAQLGEFLSKVERDAESCTG